MSKFPSKSLRCSRCSVAVIFLKRSLSVSSDLPRSSVAASYAWYSAVMLSSSFTITLGIPFTSFLCTGFPVSYIKCLLLFGFLPCFGRAKSIFMRNAQQVNLLRTCLSQNVFIPPDTWGLINGLDEHIILGWE